MGNKLSERRQKILCALVDNYITSPNPVSSNDIRDRYLPDVSSATIRSELGALEELGYLVQPHISSGRIPSCKAYRFYVDNLDAGFDDGVDIPALKAYFNDKTNEVEEVIKNTVKIISDVTNYTSVIVLGGVEKVKIKEVKLVDVGENTALVIIITDGGILKDKMIDMPAGINGNYFMTANSMLNDMFAGKCVGEILGNNDIVECELYEFRKLCNEVIDMVTKYKSTNAGKVYLEGANKIFEYKEYENIDNVKNFLSLVNTKESLNELIGQNSNIELSIKIGKEEGGQENMAIVSVRCNIGGREVGHAGVIGPERMDYKKVISVLSGLSKVLDNIEE